MLKEKICGVWKLKEFIIADDSIQEQWDKDGLLILTDNGFFSGSVNYTGNIAEDRKQKKYANRVIRDYFAAGTYKVLEDGTVEFQHLNHSMPQRINWTEIRSFCLDGNTLHEKVDRGEEAYLLMTWERAE